MSCDKQQSSKHHIHQNTLAACSWIGVLALLAHVFFKDEYPTVVGCAFLPQMFRVMPAAVLSTAVMAIQQDLMKIYSAKDVHPYVTLALNLWAEFDISGMRNSTVSRECATSNSHCSPKSPCVLFP